MTDFQKARGAAIDAFWKKGLISKTRCGEQLDAALSAFEQAGYVLVIKVPTDPIIHDGTQAFWANHSLSDDPVGGRAMWYAYRAMITAALKERT